MILHTCPLKVRSRLVWVAGSPIVLLRHALTGFDYLCMYVGHVPGAHGHAIDEPFTPAAVGASGHTSFNGRVF